jgi:DNA modification methylase
MISELKIIENKIHPKIRLNAICPYFTMFPLSFPYKVLTNARKSDVIYDPFCGRGTTNYAARLLGVRSYGVDSNPVAYAIAQSKLISIQPKEVIASCEEILKNINPTQVPDSEFWQWAFHKETLTDICKIRTYLNSKKRLTKAEIVLRAIVLGILHGPLMMHQNSYLSNQMPRTFSTKPDYSVKYWKETKLRPPKVDTLLLVSRKAKYIFNEQLPDRVDGKIVLGDSRKVSEVSDLKFDWVITSPPYYGMSTYEQDQWLRNWFLGGSERVDYSTKKQLKHWSEKAFVNDLSLVWKNAALKCKSGAKLVIRFGALPSKSDKTPSELLKESLADCGWKLLTIHKAGRPIESKRQANQFKNSTGKYVEEIDAFAILNT